MKLKILYDKPLIVYVPGWYKNPMHSGLLEDFLLKINSVEAYFIYSPAWNLANITLLFAWFKKIAHPNHHWIVACNDYYELKYMRDNNISSILAPQSCFLDEKIYNIVPSHKLYDAVYTAQMLSFKRHSLLKKVSNCALVTYGNLSEYAEEVLQQIKNDGNINLLNEIKDDKFVALNWKKITEIYNSSCVGLCLSAEEGAMYASVEYLLCGLPVVTTLSKGGRDYYFDGRYVLHCEATPEGVAEAVDVIKSATLDSSEVRNDILTKMKTERKKFVGSINTLLIEAGAKPNFIEFFEKRFTNKLLGEVVDKDEFVEHVLML